MKIQSALIDNQVLSEMGARLNHRRLDMKLSQAQLAKEAGISKRTVERMEAGGSTQVLNLIRVLRALQLLDGLDQLLPESGPRPLDLLKLKGKTRKRASTSRKKKEPETKWQWGDEK